MTVSSLCDFVMVILFQWDFGMDETIFSVLIYCSEAKYAAFLGGIWYNILQHLPL